MDRDITRSSVPVFFLKKGRSKLISSLRAMWTNSLFLPRKIMYHIALAKCYRYVIYNFMWKKKGGRRHSPKFCEVIVIFIEGFPR